MTKALRSFCLSAAFITTMALSDFHQRQRYRRLSVFAVELPCSLSKPASGSCCLYNGVHAASKQVAAALCPSLLCTRRFCNTTKRFRYFISSSPSFISLMRTCPFAKAFLCPFTTASLRTKQRRVVWQTRLYGIAGAP